MKQNAELFLLTLVLLNGAICSNLTCDGELSIHENRLLINLDKLLNQRRVAVTTGVMLRKKNDTLEATESSIACDVSSSNVVHRFIGRIGKVLNTHVLEFDLSSILNEGN